jgi:hypothetical protein
MPGGHGRGGGRHRHMAAVARDCPRRQMGPLGRHFCIRSEDTAVGRALSGAVVSMLAASSLAVLGILPSGAHILNSARHSVSMY